MAMKENTKAVITYLQGLADDVNVTAQDVATALDMEKRSVDGIFTSAVQRKGFGVRVAAEIELSELFKAGNARYLAQTHIGHIKLCNIRLKGKAAKAYILHFLLSFEVFMKFHLWY